MHRVVLVEVDEALGHPLDDGGLADPGVADEDRVVGQHLQEHADDGLELDLAADGGTELALCGQGREVAAELHEERVLARVEVVLTEGADLLGPAGLGAR